MISIINYGAESTSSDSESDDEAKKIVVGDSSSESSYEEVQTQQPDGEETAETLVQKVKFEEDKMSSTEMLPPQPRRKRFIPNYDVDGVFKVVLSEETQAQLEIVIGHHVNAQYPWKSVDKAKILEHIEMGGVESEFFERRAQIEKYDDEFILMGFVPDESTDVDEFYVCYTKEARDHCKQQSEKYIKRQEKKLQKAVEKKPGPWTSLGSEKEIAELIPVNTRALMEQEIKASFPTEYDPETFHVRDTNSVRDGYIELTPYRQKFNNVFRRRVDCGIQAAPSLVDNIAQTILKYPQNVWTQSIADALGKMADMDAGGDAGKPKLSEEKEESSEDDEVSEEPLDEVGLATFKAAFTRLRRPSYIKLINSFMSSKVAEMHSIIELNTVMDIYSNDYPNLIAQKTVDTYGTMTFEEYVCFTDVRAKDKYVSSVVFHPMWSGIVAVSYADTCPSVMKTMSTRPEPIQRAVYGLNPVMIWSHIDSLIPKLYLEAPREVKSLSFCPFNENLLIGGLINGQILVWDLTDKLENVEEIEILSETRDKYRIAMNAHMGWMKSLQNKAVVSATALSNLMHSHYGTVSTIKWLSPNFSVSPIGKMEVMQEDKKSLQFLTGSEDGNILIWNLSINSATSFIEPKKVKKSKRVPVRPSALLVDVSLYKVLDRVLQPCYKLLLGIAGKPQTFLLQSFDMNPPRIKYTYTPRNTGTGRKYFTCEIEKETAKDISKTVYCGSQHGELRIITWDGHEFNTGEVVNSEYCNINYTCCIHDGIITRTQKNPHLQDITLTVGGKIFAIWSDKVKNRPLIWKKRPHRLTDGEWSLYKPSLLFISNTEGNLEVWDLLLKSENPISVQTMSGSMLTGVSLHTLPLAKNIIGVSDTNGSFRMFLKPPIFMLENSSYKTRMETMLNREVKVMLSFIAWQDEWMKTNADVVLEIKRKEGVLLNEKEEKRKKEREALEKQLEEAEEARRLEKMKVVGPEEKWQMIIQKLIERTIAVKKRINRAELIEHERPLRELEIQRLEKEKRMLDIMQHQKSIFNDTVAILFPEAVKKPSEARKSLLPVNIEAQKKAFLEDYENLKIISNKMVKANPYSVPFCWDTTIAEGKERRQALNVYEQYLKMHRARIEEECKSSSGISKKKSRELKETLSETNYSEGFVSSTESVDGV